jgi:hypothetical protein
MKKFVRNLLIRGFNQSILLYVTYTAWNIIIFIDQIIDTIIILSFK